MRAADQTQKKRKKRKEATTNLHVYLWHELCIE